MSETLANTESTESTESKVESNAENEATPSEEVQAAQEGRQQNQRAGQRAGQQGVQGATPPKATAPHSVSNVALDDPALFFNRELSEIDFHWRVFYQAKDERLPLLERVRFLAITASNMDEFFQKRVGGLKRQEVAGVTKLSPDGRTPAEQLELIRAREGDVRGDGGALGRVETALGGRGGARANLLHRTFKKR